MTKVIEAVYEKGVFKPLEKVDLKEGEKVRIEIKIEIKESLADVIEKYSRKVEKDVLKEFLEERR